MLDAQRGKPKQFNANNHPLPSLLCKERRSHQILMMEVVDSPHAMMVTGVEVVEAEEAVGREDSSFSAC